MLVPAVGIVGNRPGVPDDAGGFLQLLTRNPACRFNHFGRISLAQRCIALENRLAADGTVACCDDVFASQGKMLGWGRVAASNRIIADDAFGQGIPGYKLSRAAAGS